MAIRSCVLGHLPSKPGQADVHWPCTNDACFPLPETRDMEFWLAMGATLLGKKCFALRLPPRWLVRLDGRAHAHSQTYQSEGAKRYIAAAFPSACGKTNLAMLVPTLDGLQKPLVMTMTDEIW